MGAQQHRGKAQVLMYTWEHAQRCPVLETDLILIHFSEMQMQSCPRAKYSFAQTMSPGAHSLFPMQLTAMYVLL